MSTVRDIDKYFLEKEEPVKSCMLALRDFIVKQDPRITEAWKYRMPFFCFNGKMFCYLWVNKKLGNPYIGFVEGKKLKHPDLIVEKRMRMKVLPVNAEKDIPVKKIRQIIKEAIALYPK